MLCIFNYVFVVSCHFITIPAYYTVPCVCKKCVCSVKLILIMIHILLCSSVFLEEKSAGSFLSRKLLYNSWDFELLVPDNLQRECMEEICSYEEAREVFEDDIQTVRKRVYTRKSEHNGSIKISIRLYLPFDSPCYGLGVMSHYFCVWNSENNTISHSFFLHLHSVPVRMGVDGQPIPESVPLANRAPGLPSYNEALTHSGQHDAPPPPYSGLQSHVYLSMM
uniref:Transmembrane gamma-carboxyglutamic acid protein 2-like n=1 Tax=Sinocyclocheilus anshuiensis TaxID=1608454 RepID=A0A671RDT5_9TELE